MEVYLFQTCSGTGTIVGLISCMLQQKYTFLPHSGQSSPRQQVWRPCQTKLSVRNTAKIWNTTKKKCLKMSQLSNMYFGSLGAVLIETRGNQLSVVARPSLWQTRDFICFHFQNERLFTLKIRPMMHQKLACLALGFSAAKLYEGFQIRIFWVRGSKSQAHGHAAPFPRDKCVITQLVNALWLAGLNQDQRHTWHLFSVFDNIYCAWQFLKSIDTFRLL